MPASSRLTVRQRKPAEESAELQAKGERIPENDTCIAAVAIECDMTLATVDDAHFLRVSGLKVEH